MDTKENAKKTSRKSILLIFGIIMIIVGIILAAVSLYISIEDHKKIKYYTTVYPAIVAASNKKTSTEANTKVSKSSSQSSNYTKSSSTYFSNKYGTSGTKCAHPGCNNNIASSGDTNCCTYHSKKCLSCGCYIDEDATWCMSCIENSAKKTYKSSTSNSAYSSSSNSSGGYYCMGKNNTCNNKTSSPYDFYCSSCDPNNDNIEG